MTNAIGERGVEQTRQDDAGVRHVDEKRFVLIPATTSLLNKVAIPSPRGRISHREPEAVPSPRPECPQASAQERKPIPTDWMRVKLLSAKRMIVAQPEVIRRVRPTRAVPSRALPYSGKGSRQDAGEQQGAAMAVWNWNSVADCVGDRCGAVQIEPASFETIHSPAPNLASDPSLKDALRGLRVLLRVECLPTCWKVGDLAIRGGGHLNSDLDSISHRRGRFRRIRSRLRSGVGDLLQDVLDFRDDQALQLCLDLGVLSTPGSDRQHSVIACCAIDTAHSVLVGRLIRHWHLAFTGCRSNGSGLGNCSGRLRTASRAPLLNPGAPPPGRALRCGRLRSTGISPRAARRCARPRPPGRRRGGRRGRRRARGRGPASRSLR